MELSRSSNTTEEIPDKILRISPEYDSVSFVFDYELHGVGGQSPDGGQSEAPGPLRVVAGSGEFVVLQELMKETIPTLIGWPHMMDISLVNKVEAAQRDAIGNPPPRGGFHDLPF